MKFFEATAFYNQLKEHEHVRDMSVYLSHLETAYSSSADFATLETDVPEKHGLRSDDVETN